MHDDKALRLAFSCSHRLGARSLNLCAIRATRPVLVEDTCYLPIQLCHRFRALHDDAMDKRRVLIVLLSLLLVCTTPVHGTFTQIALLALMSRSMRWRHDLKQHQWNDCGPCRP